MHVYEWNKIPTNSALGAKFANYEEYRRDYLNRILGLSSKETPK